MCSNSVEAVIPFRLFSAIALTAAHLQGSLLNLIFTRRSNETILIRIVKYFGVYMQKLLQTQLLVHVKK